MVFVRTVAAKTFKSENVKGMRVRNAGSDLARHIVVIVENPAATLLRKNLQSQVSNIHLACFFDAFYIVLITQRTKSARVPKSQRIDTVNSDASLSLGPE